MDQNIKVEPYVIDAVQKYADALIKKDHTKLDELTQHGGGSIGTSKNNITAFNNSGASKIQGIMGQGKQCAVLFADQQGPKCIALFDVTGEGKIKSDWELFQKI